MNINHHQLSGVTGALAWLRGHTLLAVFGLFTGLAVTVAAAQSLLTGSVLPLVFFLILGALILSGLLRFGPGAAIRATIGSGKSARKTPTL